MTSKLEIYCSCGAIRDVVVNGQDLCWPCANRRITVLLDMGRKVTIRYGDFQIEMEPQPTGRAQPSFIGMN